MHQVCAAYAAWLATASGLPKLSVNAEPGSILEDSGPQMGQAVAAGLRQLAH